MIIHKNVLNSFLVNNCRLGRVDINPPSLIFNNNNMALQVWLPLINNVENQGVSNIPIINNGVTFVDKGKIGKCASFNNNYFSLQNLSNFNTISISFWMKPANTNQTGCLLNYRTGIGLDLAIFLIQGNIRFDAGGQTTFNYIYTTDWQHVTVTYDGNIKNLYVNGILNQSVIINKAISCSATKGTVGASSVNTTSGSDNNYIGLLNDYRIYDHCLSPKEVKEISKGLVLHYPLNDAYVQNTTNLNKSIGTSWGHWGTNTITSNSFISPEGTLGSHVNCSSFTDGGVSVNHSSFSVKPNTTYVISAKMKLTGYTNKNLFYWREYNSSNTQLSENGKWSTTNVIEYGNGYKLYYGIVTTSSEASSVILQSYFYGAGEHWIYDIQVEEGSYPTPFAGYNTSRIATTIYDCSGYQNNGTISGSLSCSTNSSRYKISTVFDGISSKIINDSFPTSIVSGTNSFTICGWAYCIKGNSYNPLFHIGSSYRTTTGICLHGNGDRIEGLDINGTTIDNTHGSGYSNEKWVHQCIVYDGTTIKRYLNGNSTPIQSIACSGFKSDNNKLSVGGFWGIPFKGYLSDFRVYATALSEEDIKELYNTSCIINS